MCIDFKRLLALCIIVLGITVVDRSSAALPQFTPGLHLNIFCNTGHFPRWENFQQPGSRSIGRLVNPHTGVTFCTATLVAPDVIVTAAHCFQNEKGEPYDVDYTFVTGGQSIKEGTRVDLIRATATPMTKDDINNPGKDIEFVRLKKSLDSTKFPPAQISNVSTEFQAGKKEPEVKLSSYFGSSDPYEDGRATTETCAPTGYFTGSQEFAHNCSTTVHMSGAPIYFYRDGKMVLLGLHDGSRIQTTSTPVDFTPATANVAAGGEMLAKGLAKFQAGTLTPDSD